MSGGLSFSWPGTTMSNASASYLTPQGLTALQQFESSGDPSATNPNSSASGLYGFINSTWNYYAPQAGVDTSLYPTAASAPASIQTAVAGVTPVSNWTCTGCDPGFTNALANNPSWLSSSPTATGSGFSQMSNIGGDGIDTSVFGSPDVPTISGIVGGTTSGLPNGGGFFSNVFSIVGNFFVRSELVIVATILIVLALWAMLRRTKTGQQVTGVAKSAVKAAIK